MEKKVHYEGLTDAEVLESRKKYGANVLTPPEKDPLWKQFLEKFEDPLIIILMIAGVLSIGISFYEYFGLGEGGEVFFEPAGIFVAILLATGLAFYFELQADKEFTILNQVNDDEPVEVIRNGNVKQIPRKDVVVGDIVILNTGEEVAADGELIEAVQLHLDESTLTGEPVCGKSINKEEFDKNATYPTNHVMKGTKVMEGHGIFRVLAVGDTTEQGKVFEAAQIDGATASQILFKIKIPMIMPSVTICTFLTLTNGFKMFDQNLSLTGGDPGKQSQLLALNIYDTFYARSGAQWKGIGQAKAVVFFLLVVAIALIQLRATSSKEVQQ